MEAVCDGPTFYSGYDWGKRGMRVYQHVACTLHGDPILRDIETNEEKDVSNRAPGRTFHEVWFCPGCERWLSPGKLSQNNHTCYRCMSEARSNNIGE